MSSKSKQTRYVIDNINSPTTITVFGPYSKDQAERLRPEIALIPDAGTCSKRKSQCCIMSIQEVLYFSAVDTLKEAFACSRYNRGSIRKVRKENAEFRKKNETAVPVGTLCYWDLDSWRSNFADHILLVTKKRGFHRDLRRITGNKMKFENLRFDELREVTADEIKARMADLDAQIKAHREELNLLVRHHQAWM